MDTISKLNIVEAKKGSPPYPRRMERLLCSKAPELLLMMGNVSLLDKDALGFCGSRDVTEKGLRIARDCTEQAVQLSRVIISGNARGVDRAVHKTALECGGETILVLAEGMQSFYINTELRSVWDWNRVLVISEFAHNATWKTWHAMQRNRTILSLVSAMIVIEAGKQGGTIAAGKDALKFGVPLFVVNREDVQSSLGGVYLLERGGFRLNKSNKTGRANMKQVFSIVEKIQRIPVGRYAQTTLF